MAFTILHGTFLDAPGAETLRTRTGYIITENGFITAVSDVLPEKYSGLPVTECGEGIVIPAFSDLHIHVSQYAQRGTGMDKLLADWLNDYTFPQEARFADAEYAMLLYRKVCGEMLQNGTMHAAMFPTIHKASCDFLFELVRSLGMQAYIGPVNMDRNCPDYLRQNAGDAVRETEAFLAEHSGDERVKPILTPRFAPTSSTELMKGLGKLAKKYAVGLQTHLVESLWEAKASVEGFPDCACDAAIYERYGLLGNGPAIFAHVIFPSEKDLAILRKYNSVAVHCPEATTNVIAGIMPAERLLHRDAVRIALGTDVGSGAKPAVYRQIAFAVQLAKQLHFYFPDCSGAVTFPEAFYMAVTEGGKLFDRVGLLEPGYRLDALVLDGLSDAGVPLTPEEKLERFCYCGDDRNIVKRYLNGKEICGC